MVPLVLVTPLQNAILATLSYHDIFNYPLSADQIFNFLPVKTTKQKLGRELALLTKSHKLTAKGGKFYLLNRGELIKINYQRTRYSRGKLKFALLYSKLLRVIPTIKMVALTGALAMGNSSSHDDVDFLIVSSKSQLWSTRLAANLVLYPYKRKPAKRKTKDKACLNIFLAENSLKISTQNLYTAHEVAQTRPIWQRGSTYQKYVKANSWVQNYLPNWQPYSTDSFTTYPQSKFAQIPIYKDLLPFEALAKWGQLRYMRKRITIEKIGNYQLFFHPSDTQHRVLSEYKKNLAKLKIYCEKQ